MFEPIDAFDPLKIFYSYSHRDEEYRQGLSSALSLLRRRGLVQDWCDRKIVAGSDWAGEIDSHLETADIVVLLVSQDFLASDYCSTETKRALDLHRNRSIDVIPVVVREVDLVGAPFAHLQYLPKDGLAISSWPNVDAAYKDVAVGIRTAVDRLQHGRAAELQRGTPDAVIHENRKLDAAIAEEIPIDLPREVAVQVRLEASHSAGSPIASAAFVR